MAFLELLVVLLQAVLRIVEHQGLHTHTISKSQNETNDKRTRKLSVGPKLKFPK